MNKIFSSKVGLKGVVERRLYDGRKLEVLKLAMKLNLPKDDIDMLDEWAAKPQFKDNILWKLIKKVFKVDLKIPYLTGFWTIDPIKVNTITNVGKKIAADQIGGTTTAPVTAVAIGIGSPSATALGSEITTAGGERGAATVTNTTTTTTGDTEQWVKSFAFTGSFAVTEEGLFDNNSTGGNMLASQSFSAVNVVSTDVFQVTHKVQVT
jgi:hypothetical protein